MTRPPSRVREPVQVYLDSDEKLLLEEVARTAGIPQAEVLRRGLRRVAGELLAAAGPGASLDQLIGVLGRGSDSADLPSDLAQNHDAYLYPPESGPGPRCD